jgi:hypothetical protein
MLGNIRVCDVYGTTNKTRRYLIDITVVEGDGPPVVGRVVQRFEKDLCPRALDRLVNFIMRGIAPPTPKTEATQTTLGFKQEADK